MPSLSEFVSQRCRERISRDEFTSEVVDGKGVGVDLRGAGLSPEEITRLTEKINNACKPKTVFQQEHQ